MPNPQLLLVDDVDDLGRKGEVVSVKPGFARNFLLPQQKAVIADKYTLKLREKLQKERAEQSAIDSKESEALAKKLSGIELKIIVKIDPAGHMYGSVSYHEIIALFEEKGITMTRKNIALQRPIKELGEHTLTLNLNEDVPAKVKLIIESDIPLPKKDVEEPAPEAEASVEEDAAAPAEEA